MAANDAFFSVTGYVATQPQLRNLKDGTPVLTFRLGWTPRVINRNTGEWSDTPSSFVSVTCFRKVAENAGRSLRRGDPVVLKGTLRVREWTDRAGTKRPAVEVTADFLGHDLAKGTTNFTKQARHTERTAEEFQRAQAGTAVRQPLPGDVVAGSQGAEGHAGADEMARALAGGWSATGADGLVPTASGDQEFSDPDLDPDGQIDPEAGSDPDADTDDFDEHAAMAELDSRDREPEPAGART